MKLFERSGGHWLFWSGVCYISVALIIAISPYSQYTWYIQIVWLSILSLPLVCNPLARWLNMKENHMFDWMKKNKLPKNVVPFPVPKSVPKVPYIEPPAPKQEPKTYYTFGITDDNRVSFSMGYTTLTMNHAGVQNLIDQLEFFKDQLHNE